MLWKKQKYPRDVTPKMARVAANLLVILLIIAFSSLLSWDATATSGRKALLYASHELQAADENNQIKSEKHEEEEGKEFINTRYDFLGVDYPPTGANNRHMPPKPPAGKD